MKLILSLLTSYFECRAQYASAIHVTAMTNKIKLFLLSLFMMTCVTDYSVITNPDIIVKDTSEVVASPEVEVVVEHFVQPDKPENLDVLFCYRHILFDVR